MEPKKIHIDTDFGGDIDDICALAFLLKSPQAEITGITTVAENSGKRAGQVEFTLKIADRSGIPVKSGADNAGGFYPTYLGLPSEKRYWPEPITPLANPVGEALDLLKQSIEQGAAIVAIGPLTNLYLLDVKYPGILSGAEIFFMGGYINPSRPGFLGWRNTDDFNIQIDIRSAKHVLANSNITLVPLPVAGETFLRQGHLESLENSGNLGRLLARQAVEFAKDANIAQIHKDCEKLPNDIINFQYDPLAAAIALGWDGAVIEKLPLIVDEENGELLERINAEGKFFNVVTSVDGVRFSEFWLSQVIKP